MSRIGKKPIIADSGVKIEFDSNTRIFKAKGKLGELVVYIHPLANLNIDGNTVTVTVQDDTEKFQKSLWGTTRSLVNNAVMGVTQGYSKSIELNGVGYKMELSGQDLTLYVGFSHPVKITAPQDIKLTLAKNVLSGTSIDKQLIGNFFGEIFRIRPIEPYKGKGFKFPGVYYQRKEVKKK